MGSPELRPAKAGPHSRATSLDLQVVEGTEQAQAKLIGIVLPFAAEAGQRGQPRQRTSRALVRVAASQAKLRETATERKQHNDSQRRSPQNGD